MIRGKRINIWDDIGKCITSTHLFTFEAWGCGIPYTAVSSCLYHVITALNAKTALDWAFCVAPVCTPFLMFPRIFSRDIPALVLPGLNSQIIQFFKKYSSWKSAEETSNALLLSFWTQYWKSLIFKACLRGSIPRFQVDYLLSNTRSFNFLIFRVNFTASTN